MVNTLLTTWFFVFLWEL